MVLTKENMQIAHEHSQRYPILHATKKLQIKTMRCHYAYTGLGTTEITDNDGEDRRTFFLHWKK